MGFIGLNGATNQAITIRTFVSRQRIVVQTGGGIVARSEDEYELQRSEQQTRCIEKAMNLAVTLKINPNVLSFQYLKQ